MALRLELLNAYLFVVMQVKAFLNCFTVELEAKSF